MAKSERKSKWKRKFRAIKREKNKPKELNALKKVLQNDKAGTIENMMDLTTKPDETKSDEQNMEIEKKKYSSKTMRDENGQYPPWMNQRRIKKIKASNKRLGKKKLKK